MGAGLEETMGHRFTYRRSHIAALLFSMATVAAAGAPGLCAAQSYPGKAVRVVVPFPAGGGTDIQARVIFKELQEQLKQPIVIENRPGASGLIGADAVINAPADGYSLLFTTATIAINASLYAGRMKFDPAKDLVSVILVSTTPLVVVVHPSVPAKSMKELIGISNRGTGLNAAINVPGSTSHLAMEMFKQLAGVRATAVPYKGGVNSMVALISGEVDFQFAEGLLAAPQIRAGKIRALAVSTAKSSPSFPDLPTVNATLPGLVADNWFAMYVRAGVPREIVSTINREVGKTLETKAVRSLFQRDALTAIGGTPEHLSAHMKSEIARYAEVIRKGSITVQ
jgi:tripartite-type tricarboxylate transporter receptor subunit TctC